MSMIQTEKGTKKFTGKEKLEILTEAEEGGVEVTFVKYDFFWRPLIIGRKGQQ